MRRLPAPATDPVRPRPAGPAAPPGPYVHLRAAADGVRVHGMRSACLGGGGRDGAGARGEPFARWEWDGGCLTVGNDRYGMFPLYYWAGPGRIAVSPRIGDLLALGAPADLDHDALAVFLRMGFFVGEDTPFASVRALPPDARLRWSPGSFRLTSGQVVPSRRETGRARAVDDCVELFRQAIGRRMPDGEYVLPLRGGRDSRHILLELARRGARPRLAVTTAEFVEHDADARIARHVAEATGTPHRIVPRPRSQLRAELVANRAQQMCTTEGAWLLPVSRSLDGRTPLTYDGLGAAALSHSPFLNLAREQPATGGDALALARWLLMSGRRDRFLPALLDEEGMARFSARRAADRLATELRRHTEAAFPLMSFYFWNRTRRAVAAHTCTLLGRGGRLPVRTPFLDHDLFDLLASLPPEVLIDGGFHTEVIRRAYPRHAHLPYADEPTPHGPRFVWGRVRYLTDTLAHVARHDRHWWHGCGGLLPRLLSRHGEGSGTRAVNRLLPFAVYLLQLDDLSRTSAAAGSSAGTEAGA
ncbi:asparagine synthetase B family protein [Streptomyces aureoversilis]|uniref:asparagine synthase (glutamine-hydrolyzing) n=1 Tax=Streptomyces aureoversilis TaxID=67277 RepID=A0ABV9ZZI1_9ACTN